jgi:uridine kinase
VVKELVAQLDNQWITSISTDSYYAPLSPYQHAHVADYDFDVPGAFDWELLINDLRNLSDGKMIHVPVYDFVSHSRLPAQSIRVYGADVIILEGIFALWHPDIRAMMDMKIFVDTDDDVRLARRIRRDIAERGRDLEGVLNQYLRFVKPSHEDHVRPTMRYADVIVPRGVENVTALNLLVGHVQAKVTERRAIGAGPSVSTAAKEGPPDVRSAVSLNPRVHAVKQTQRCRAMQTLLRDKTTSANDFIFYGERFIRIVLEEAMAHLPRGRPRNVTTPTGSTFSGNELFASPLVAVSIMRGGDPLVMGLKQLSRKVTCGRMLIQSDSNRTPHLVHIDLPVNIQGKTVLLLDSVLGTGQAARMAVQVLVEHGVKQEDMMFVCLIAAPQGIYRLTSHFPSLTIVTGAIDQGLNERGLIIPGLGNFASRFYGTKNNQEPSFKAPPSRHS